MAKIDIEIEFKKEIKQENKALDPHVEFSSKLITCLKNVAKNHNANYSKKVNLYQLKEVFSHASEIYQSSNDVSKVLYSLARVEMFLRILSGDYLFPSFAAKEVIDASIDASNIWNPSEKDFSIARDNIKKFDLDFKFNSIEDLYLEDFKNNRYIDII